MQVTSSMTFRPTRPSIGASSSRSNAPPRGFRSLGSFVRWGLTCSVFVMTSLWGSSASAEKMDFALERLAENSDTCRTDEGYSSGIEVCRPDNAAFLNLVHQFGMAIAPSAMYDARTTGYGGFEVVIEGTYTSVNGDAEYMKQGTRGSVDPTSGRAAEENDSPSSLLQMYSLRVRKSFGFGFETGLQFGFMPGTSLISGGADVRLSILEGFRRSIPGYLPDLAVMGSARTITGTAQVQLTVAAVSGVISKPITVAESAVVTPWVGYQHLFLFGDSGVIDFTPAENALQACGYQGPSQPGTPDREGADDGSPVCADEGIVEDFNNNKVFTPVRLMRQRMIFGAKYRYEILTIGGQVMADVFNSKEKINSDEEARALEGEPNNFAFSLQVGALF